MIRILGVSCNVQLDDLSGFNFPIYFKGISYNEFLKSGELNYDVLIWNNNYSFERIFLNKLTIKFFINWGTDDSNICKLPENINLYKTKSYCTEAVCNFTLKHLENIELNNKTIGFIGMGDICYSVAEKTKTTNKIIYNSKTKKKGLVEFEYVCKEEIAKKSDIIIIAINSNKPAFKNKWFDGSRSPLIINLSKESVFPKEQAIFLRERKLISSFISDNKIEAVMPKGILYTHHKAYKSEESKKNKISILKCILLKYLSYYHDFNFSLFIARHGETEWNKKGVLQGCLNSSLTPLGEKQAINIAKFIKRKNIKKIYSSPLSRCTKTATIISQQIEVPLEIVEDLQEISFGEFNGKKKDLLTKSNFTEIKKSDKLYAQHPLGESYYDAYLRLINPVRKIVSNGDNSLIIGHESVNRIIRAIALGTDVKNSLNWKQSNDHIIELDFSSSSQSLYKLK